jgi:hypothetical protein
MIGIKWPEKGGAQQAILNRLFLVEVFPISDSGVAIVNAAVNGVLLNDCFAVEVEVLILVVACSRTS